MAQKPPTQLSLSTESLAEAQTWVLEFVETNGLKSLSEVRERLQAIYTNEHDRQLLWLAVLRLINDGSLALSSDRKLSVSAPLLSDPDAGTAVTSPEAASPGIEP